MDAKEPHDKSKYIELNAFLKLKNIATTGGQAKILIRSGNIKVNGNVETRNKKKLIANDVVNYGDSEYIITSDILLMIK